MNLRKCIYEILEVAKSSDSVSKGFWHFYCYSNRFECDCNNFGIG